MLVLQFAPNANASPTPMPADWHAPRAWLRDAVCIHGFEGAWNSIGYVHGRATYAGGMQFLVSTWQAAGGRESTLDQITRAPIREQLYRAWITWDRDRGRVGDGRGSWREWGTAGRCGLE